MGKNPMLTAYLTMVAAKAQELAKRAEHGGFWPGELKNELESIQKYLDQAKTQSGN